MEFTAQDLTIMIHGINRFHQLDPTAEGYEDQVAATLLTLNQIVNPWRFEWTVTPNNTIIMVMMT